LAEYIAAGHEYTRLLIARHQVLVAQAKSSARPARTLGAPILPIKG
jgi:hypothetical protein